MHENPAHSHLDQELNTMTVTELNLRSQFPLLAGSPVIFFDSAASAQKPEVVLSAMDDLYRFSYANVHRGVYRLAEESTVQYEAARETVRKFINASSTREIIFTRGTTESINLVAYSWARNNLHSGDRVLLTILEHHSNIVPWQILAQERGIVLDWVDLSPDEDFSRELFEKKLALKPKLVCCTMIANALGVEVPIHSVVKRAHEAGAVVLVDAAQGAPHRPIDVQALGADFLAFSSHKLYGPTGIGVLFGKEAILDAMPPFLGGGEMIRAVTKECVTFNDLPHKFEAGTPAIAEAVGLGAAIKFIEDIGWNRIIAQEEAIVRALEIRLGAIDGVRVLGPRGRHAALVTVSTERVHAHDMGQFLDSKGIACRAGNHCAQPLMKHFGIASSVRASVGIYNSIDEVDKLGIAIEEALHFFS